MVIILINTNFNVRSKALAYPLENEAMMQPTNPPSKFKLNQTNDFNFKIFF